MYCSYSPGLAAIFDFVNALTYNNFGQRELQASRAVLDGPETSIAQVIVYLEESRACPCLAFTHAVF